MLPGPDQILKTRGAGSLVKIHTLMSGNTFGATFWTDGKCEAPMLPEQPRLRVHPETGELFWVDECKQIGSREPWKAMAEHAHVPYARDPTPDDFIRALSSGFVWKPDREKYVRIRIWWACNDPVRRGEAAAPTRPGHLQNLNRLRQLLDKSDSTERLLAAEACREAGQFAEAAKLLARRLLGSPFRKEHESTARRIAELAAQGDRIVRPLSDVRL